MSQILTLMLVAIISFLPVQVALANTVTIPTNSPVELHPENKKVALDTTEKSAVPAETYGMLPLSNNMMIGIGAGAAVLLGVAVAVDDGSGGSDPAPVVPPTAAQLVDAWQAVGDQPGSGRTYTGTYHLYDGGSIGYDLQVSSGEHLVGTGSWRITDYYLEIHTDHGSLYSGQFTPGIYTSIHMNATSQWNLHLTR